MLSIKNMLFVLLFYPLTIMALPLSEPSEKQLKTMLTFELSECLKSYNSFTIEPSSVKLIQGTKYAAKALAILEIIHQSYPNSFTDKDYNTLLVIANGCSDKLPSRFVENPDKVLNDPGFPTFLNIARVQIKNILGEPAPNTDIPE